MRCNDVNLIVSTVRVKILDTGREALLWDGIGVMRVIRNGEGRDCLQGKCGGGICVKLGIFNRLIVVEEKYIFFFSMVIFGKLDIAKRVLIFRLLRYV